MQTLNTDIHLSVYVFWSVRYVRTVGMTVLLTSLKQTRFHILQ